MKKAEEKIVNKFPDLENSNFCRHPKRTEIIKQTIGIEP